MSEKMKPSGIAWIGDIPAEWNLTKVRFATKVRSEKGYYCSEDKYIGLENISSYTGQFIPAATEYDPGFYDVYRKGDVLFNKLRPYLAKALIAEDDGFCTGELEIISDYQGDKRFLFYYLLSDGFLKMVDASTYGTKMPRANWDYIKNLQIPVIPHQEQCAIADFLDAQCAKIDSIIADIEKQIETLKQYKQSLVYETTVGGLKKEVTKRSSDIDWVNIGIPEQWKTKKIRYLFQLRDERNYRPLEEVNLISLYTDLGVVQHSDLETTTGNKAYTADGYKKVYKDDIVVNIILCWMGAIGISDYEGVTSPAYDVYLPIDKKTVYPRYYHYLFKSERFHGKCYSVGRGIMAMRWRTYSSEFKNIDVPLPTYDEQVEIADFLDKKCEEIDAIIQSKQAQRDIIAQHKKSLIYEYVTGKKRVTEVN